MLARLLLIVMLIFTLLSPAVADFRTAPAGQTDAGGDRRTIDFDTDRFRIVLDTEAEDLRQLLAVEAERALDELAPRLGVKLDHRIQLVVYTHTDDYAGYTDILDRTITLSLGVPLEAENQGDHFIRALLRHELVHYLVAHRLETIPGGTGRGLGWVILPMWFHEGVSEHFSTGWDSLREILVRTALREGRVGAEQMNLFYYADSLGRRLGYDLGHSFVRFLVERFGESVLEKILAETRRFHPRFRSILHRATGDLAGELFHRWKEEGRKRGEELLAGRRGLESLGAPVDTRARVTLNPLFSPDGRSLYYASNRDRDYFTFSLYRRDLQSGQETRLLGNLQYRFDLSPDGRWIAFSRRTPRRHGQPVSDIYLLDLETGRIRPLTRDRMAANPSWSPDGTMLVYTVVEAARQNLWRMNADGSGARPLTDLAAGEAAYSPAWDGDRVLFVLRDCRGDSRIRSLGMDGEDARTLSASRHLIMRPRFCSFCPADRTLRFLVGDGRFIDLAEQRADGSLRRLTESRQGLLDFDLSPDGTRIAVSEIGAQGIQLFLLPTSALGRFPDAAALASAPPAPPCPVLPPARIVRQRTRYDGMPQFRHLIPWLDSAGDTPMLGFRSRLMDPAGRNRIDLMALQGQGDYHTRTLQAVFGGMNPSFGLALYDMEDEFRPAQNRTLRGGELFALYRATPRLRFSGRLFRRTLTSNSISPWYVLRHPATGDVDGRDAGVAAAVDYYHAEASVDQDIHPLNLVRLQARHQRTSRMMDSLYDYRFTRLALDRTLIVGRRRQQIALRAQYGHASGDWDFQFGGPGEFRGYRSRPLAGPRIAGFSLEYQWTKLRRGFYSPLLALQSIYPSLFYDRGAAWTNRADWRGSAGLELGSRVLLFNKLSVGAVWGVARQLDHRREAEIYGQLQINF